MSDIIDGLYPLFLQQGGTPSLFWSLSIGEILDIIKNSTKKYEQETKQKIILHEILANQIYEKVASIMSKGVHYTRLSEYFPDLFESEEAVDNSLALYKAQMEDYAWKHNHREAGEKQWME